MSKFEELCERTVQWSIGIDLYNQSTIAHQKAKAFEELGELIVAINENDGVEIIDAIGDISVCIVNVCYLSKDNKKIKIRYGWVAALRDWLGLGVDRECIDSSLGQVAYGICCDFQGAISALRSIAKMYYLDFNHCFEVAVETIEKRKLLMVNGKAVKWENMTEEQRQAWRVLNENN